MIRLSASKNWLATALVVASMQVADAQDKPAAVTDEARMQWWKDAKLGMFIHWGVYAVPAGTHNGKPVEGIGEWIMLRGKIPVAEYKAYAKEFNPVKYDPEAWVKMAKEAGMKYIVITAKHHDGFALFDSKVTDWDVVDATPYGQDLLKPLVAACRRQGMKIGFYYSQAQDWTHPGGAAAGGGHWDKAQDGSMDEYIDQIALPQVKEILSNYGDMDVLWWDTPANMTPQRAAKFNEVIKKYPKLIVNNRLGGGFKGDTETPEQLVPATGFPGRNWETCMTMNDTWGFKANDQNWKSTAALLRNLADIASKGGNFLLNVGPTAAGEIPAPSVERLAQMGAWLKVNGESLYGTTASPFPYLSWGRATRKGQKLYLHVFAYPADGHLRVPMNNTITGAYMLASPDQKLSIKKETDRSSIALPAQAPDKINSVVVIEFTGEPGVLPLPMLGKKAVVSSQKSTDEGAANMLDQDRRTHWVAAKGERSATVEVDLGQPIAISSFVVDEPWHTWDNRSQTIALQYQENDQWKTAAQIQTKGVGQLEKFKPVTARRFRLLVENKESEPTLSEWQLYRPE